jgi:hypothetical protein
MQAMWEHIWYRELQAAPSDLPAPANQSHLCLNSVTTMQAMWEHIWYRELQAAPSELPALLTQPPTTPGTVRHLKGRCKGYSRVADPNPDPGGQK